MFTKLFQPRAIGKVQLKNRIMMSPMGSWLASDDGFVTDRQIAYYVARAAGGAGAIIVEATFLTGDIRKRLCLNSDQFVPGLKRLSDAIHETGAMTFLQIHPSTGRFSAKDPVSASQVVSKAYASYTAPASAKTRALTIEEIEQIVADFGDAVLRAKAAGFDGVEVHAGHGYLVADFLSPVVNRRTDGYGGSLENRARLAAELIKSAKHKAGGDYPVIFRLSIDEIGGTLSLDEAVAISQILEKAGANAIDVDSGGAESKDWVGAPYYIAPGYNAHYSHRIKKAVMIPISVAGRINDPHVAEDILESNKADFVTLGRALIADPEFPNKTAEGKANEIRKCIACQECYEAVLAHGIPVRCTVNAAAGRESEARQIPTSKRKRVLIIGGGPGGMEAARVASLRGHNVTLWEKSERLGGQVNLAVVPPCKQELANVIRYLTGQLNKSGITVELGMEATLASIIRYEPDAVIVATGSIPIMPDVLGVSTTKLVTAHQVLASSVVTGQKVVIIGGGTVGCETADYLATLGRQVSIVEILETIAADASLKTRPFLVARLEKQGVQMFSKVSHEERTDEGLNIIDGEGKHVTLEADSIVCACGTKPDNELFRELEGKVPELYAIGDCVQPRKILDAIHEGAAVGQKI